MSYQERIYSQNGNCNRNFAGPVPTTSSDICVFNRPSFIMSGASSIDCSELTCSISGISYTDLFTATTECFTSTLSGTCFNSVDWVTNVYEDDVLAYTNIFYSSSGITGPIIDVTTFSGSVVTAFNTLGYDYSFDGTEYSIFKPLGVDNIKLELTTDINFDDDCPVTGNTTGDTVSCTCPSGYTATIGNDSCQIITYSSATYNGSDITAIAGTPNSAYGIGGALFYADITDESLPIRDRLAGSGIMDNDSVNIPFLQQVKNSVWGLGSITTGRLNDIGVWGVGIPTNEWVGFAYCLDIPESGKYVIGIGADDKMRVKLNGETIVNFLRNGNGFTHQYWYMLPITLKSGINILELEGLNEGSAASFGAEIYDSTIEALSAMTTVSEVEAVTLFTTGDLVGTDFELGETSGYSCPSGFTIDACFTGSTRCVSILSEDITCVFTGSCLSNDVLCDLEFSGITLDDTNVHLLTGQTTFDLTFDFTGNTSSFIDNNSRFKYEIYKYLPNLGYFNNVPVFTSEYFDWVDFSGTSAFTTSVTASTIDPDGEYLVKGQFIHDVCTEFATLLGYKYTTTENTSGEAYGLYQPDRDYYFLAFGEAQTPVLINDDDSNNTIGALVVSSVELDGTTNEFNLPNKIGDYLISLNGITLSPGEDYSINQLLTATSTVYTITLSADTVEGDILTYVYTNSETTNNLKSDVYPIDTNIVSGTTDGEGSNTIYYNTDTNKYEIFLSMTPIANNSIGITLNGVTLANGIDYYQSTSNPKRIIFEGNLLVGDIVNSYYNTNTNVQGNQFGTTVTIQWVIAEPPIDNNGLFTIEISEDDSFTSIISSGTTQYETGTSGYGITINLTGEIGDKQYYRVKNTKNFNTLCNETLTSEVYSEIANITIQTNLNNSY